MRNENKVKDSYSSNDCALECFYKEEIFQTVYFKKLTEYN